MTKAEQRALEAYPVDMQQLIKFDHSTEFVDANNRDRAIYRKGYEQAEKDPALTWEDVSRIVGIYNNYWEERQEDMFIDGKPALSEKQIYSEVLKRFNEYKEDKK